MEVAATMHMNQYHAVVWMIAFINLFVPILFWLSHNPFMLLPVNWELVVLYRWLSMFMGTRVNVAKAPSAPLDYARCIRTH